MWNVRFCFATFFCFSLHVRIHIVPFYEEQQGICVIIFLSVSFSLSLLLSLLFSNVCSTCIQLCVCVWQWMNEGIICISSVYFPHAICSCECVLCVLALNGIKPTLELSTSSKSLLRAVFTVYIRSTRGIFSFSFSIFYWARIVCHWRALSCMLMQLPAQSIYSYV